MKREKAKILDNKIFLYLTEFFSGMSVMAVELGASRLLAPYFSSSQIVWTIVIGTIMIAMALGNIYGGKSADKNPNPDRLYGRIIISAIWIALIPVVGKYIILGVSALLIFTVNSNFLIIAAFAACMLIFVFPLFLLGTVTPSLAKYSVENLEESLILFRQKKAVRSSVRWEPTIPLAASSVHLFRPSLPFRQWEPPLHS